MAIVAGLLLWPALAAAQAARPGTLRVTVRDATGLAVAGAAVAAVTVGGEPVEATTDSTGQATLTLPPGRGYAVDVSAPGFERLHLQGVEVRSGARATREVELRIAAVVEEVEVAPAEGDRPLLDAFVTELDADAIAALPSDPEELRLVLQELAGGDAELRVDGFAGGELPPGTQIQEVRIRYDVGAASGDGRPRIEIRTRPGGDRWRADGSLTVRDERLNARNAFSNERPSGQTRQHAWTFSGPLVRNRTGLSLSIDRSDAMEQQTVRAATPGGLFSALVSQPAEGLGFSARLDHLLTPAQTMRLEIRTGSDRAVNQGIGELDLPERGYTRERSNGRIRASHRATSPRLVNDLRFQFAWDTTESGSASDEITTRVLDAFTSGGAQIAGGRRSRTVEIEDELEATVAEVHQITAGITVNGAHDSGDERRNARGTFTFPSLDAYLADRPTTFTQRIGDPRYGYALYRFGWSLQDSYRVRRDLMITAGLRQDAQTHLRDWANFSPSVSASWTPIPGRRTTLRASYAVFHDAFGASLYEQTLRVNGQQQSDLVISDPGYPDPLAGGVARAARPPGIIRTSPELDAPSTRRLRIGVDHALAPWARLRATYARTTGAHLFRSRDANAPVNGVRPDLAVRNITQIESTARSLANSLDLQLSLTHRPRRFTATLGYTLGEAWNDSDGALALPPDSFDLAGEWGPSRQDVRHRVSLSVNTDVAAGFRVNARLRAQSGAPYAITTGVDANGDGENNERPDGVGRNAGRGAGSKNLDLTLTWGIGVGQPRAAAPPPPGGGAGRGGRDRGGNSGGGGAGERVRLEVYARISNLLNLVNPQGFSGVLTSPFFGQPTSAGSPRRIIVGSRVRF
ncbi:MAG: carboxypeptidase regulatory-like domain-containing protein [Acidobacteria bacterium]|nr:carboxypeptidase regulatory-like domain-containing protein [Acidobacteriota bacterium]